MMLGGRRFLLGSALLGAGVCLALGISLPVMKFTRFVFFSHEHSLIATVNALVRSGQYFLGATVLVFCILLPVMKLLYLMLLSILPQRDLGRLARPLQGLEWFGRWSMHDVLVLSLAIFLVKSHGVYDATSVPGLYFFAAAVVLMMLAYAWLRGEAVTISTPVGRFAAPSTVRSLLFSLLILLAVVSLALGLMLPAIRFTTVYVWSNQHSIATVIWALYSQQDYFLGFVVLVFSVVLPFLKLLYLLTLVSSNSLPLVVRARSIAAMEWLGRFSMTDIMVLALMIFYINASGYSEATVLPGVYFFAASALMTMLAFGWVNATSPAVAPPMSSLQARLAEISPAVHGERLSQR